MPGRKATKTERQVAFPGGPAAQPYFASQAGQATSGDVRDLIERYFPQAEWDNATAVATCESGQRSVVSAPNSDGSVDMGVFQLNSGGTLQRLLSEFGLPQGDTAKALDASWNVQAAALLFSQRGWQPWTCARRIGIFPVV